jgi:hypothetical protein
MSQNDEAIIIRDAKHETVADLVASYGGSIWNDHPVFPGEDWKYEVQNGDTRASYWEWCYSQVQSRYEDLE